MTRQKHFMTTAQDKAEAKWRMQVCNVTIACDAERSRRIYAKLSAVQQAHAVQMPQPHACRSPQAACSRPKGTPHVTQQ